MNLNERFRGFLPVVVDVETGGTVPQIHALLELSVTFLKWEQNQLHLKNTQTWHVTPHPDTKCTDKSLEVTHIDPEDPERVAESEESAIRDAFRVIRKEVRDAGCTRALLTAHNAHFDHGFIMAAVNRNEIGRNPFHPFTVLDTASICAIAVGHTVLKEAAHRLEITYQESAAHASAYDAEIAAQVFCAIVNRSSYVDDS